MKIFGFTTANLKQTEQLGNVVSLLPRALLIIIAVNYQRFMPLLCGYLDVRFILAVVAKFDLELHHIDIKTAFVNGNLRKIVYLEIPEGYC